MGGKKGGYLKGWVGLESRDLTTVQHPPPELGGTRWEGVGDEPNTISSKLGREDRDVLVQVEGRYMINEGSCICLLPTPRCCYPLSVTAGASSTAGTLGFSWSSKGPRCLQLWALDLTVPLQ